MNDWSDIQKWRMDLLKSAISFTVAAVVSLFIIDTVQANRAQEKARAEAYYATRLKALEDFRASTVAYDLAAHTAYAELYQWKSKVKTPAMLRYEQEAYPSWWLSIENIQHLFPTHVADAQTLAAKGQERHSMYDRLVDKRLDTTGVAAIDPWSTRKEFNELSESMRKARTELIAKLQGSMFPSSLSK